jgi:glutamate racemase
LSPDHHPIHLEGNLVWIVEPASCSLFVVFVMSKTRTRAVEAENIDWIYHSMVIIQDDVVVGCPHFIVVGMFHLCDD